MKKNRFKLSLKVTRITVYSLHFEIFKYIYIFCDNIHNHDTERKKNYDQKKV